VSILSFNHSRSSEGKSLGLLQCEEVVPVQICYGPYNRNYEKRDEACPVADDPGKWEHDRYPPDNIVGNIDDPAKCALLCGNLGI